MFAGLFWTAPELLRDSPEKKSQAGDVFSYGVILNEIMTREAPYETLLMESTPTGKTSTLHRPG